VGTGGGDAVAESTADATEGQDASATSIALSEEEGRTATAISTAIADEGGPASAKAIAEAIGEGFGNAVAVAIGQSVDAGLEDDASTAIADAYAIAVSEGAGDAYANALAIGLASDDATRSAYAVAVSKVLKAEGCEAFRPTLAEAQAVAIADGTERDFVDAIDFDVQIAECLFDMCDGNALACCEPGVVQCECRDTGCSYSLFKSTPRNIWTLVEDDSKCMCPPSV